MLFILRSKLKLQICKQIYKMKNEFKKDSQSIKLKFIMILDLKENLKKVIVPQ